MVALYTEAELRPGPGIQSLAAHPGRRGHSIPLMKAVSLFSESEEPTSTVRMGSPLSVQVAFSAAQPIRPILGVTLKTAQGAPIFGVSNRWTYQGVDASPVIEGTIACNFEELPLNPGTYLLDLYFGEFADLTRDLDIVMDAISFEVFGADVYGTGLLPASYAGPVFCNATWELA
jgi:Wzt C-terminal domain